MNRLLDVDLRGERDIEGETAREGKGGGLLSGISCLKVSNVTLCKHCGKCGIRRKSLNVQTHIGLCTYAAHWKVPQLNYVAVSL